MDAAGEHWRVAANGLIAAIDALATGQPDVVEAHTAEILSRAERIGYDPFGCWGHLMQAWVAQQRDDPTSANVECERAVALARRVGLGHFYAFALTQLGWAATLAGDLERADEQLREAVSTADACGAGWFSALARARLAQVRLLRGDPGGARSLARDVLDRDDPDRHTRVRGFVFQVIGGDPFTIAAALLA
jgi:sugar phosphate isomerase/epimerase